MYRTQEQRESMIEDVMNGNRKDAGKTGAEGGRHAVDLVNWYEENGQPIDATDLVYLMEMICDAR